MCVLRDIAWVGGSLEDLKKMPSGVHQEIGYALYEIQKGNRPKNVKQLKGLGTGVIEIISNVNKNTYRAVCAIKFDSKIYVLHVFQKKSKTGIKTPKQEIALIKQRLSLVKRIR